MAGVVVALAMSGRGRPASADDSPIQAAAWGRIGTVVSNGRDGFDDLSQSAEVNLKLGGRVHEMIDLQAGMVGTYPPGIAGAGSVQILDLIGKFTFHDTFNLWIGRMLVPSDRANFAGPWFQAPWNFHGGYVPGGPLIGPHRGPFGRNDGMTAWGQLGAGTFKYFAGVFDLHDIAQSPLYTVRLSLSLLNPEPGPFHSSTYYGKDLLSFGLSAQMQRGGSVDPMLLAAADDFYEINADALFESVLGGGWVLDLEAAAYLFRGDNEPVDRHGFFLASLLLPWQVGIGKLQPLVRVQAARPYPGGDWWRLLDAQVTYVIKGYAARVALGFQHGDTGAVETNQLFLGVQLQK